MSPVLTTTPARTQAAILRHVAGERFPKLALGNIAHHYGLSLPDLQAILQAHGYPDPDRMRLAADQLAAEHVDDVAELNPSPEEDQATEQHPDQVLEVVPLAQIHTDPDNVREHLTGIEELADSILSVGLLQPIVCRRAGRCLIVVAGHRRLAALRHLKHTETRVLIKNEMRPDEVLAAMLIENGQRTDLDPIEEARGLHRLKVLEDLSDAELARKVGRSQPLVSSRLALLDLSPDEQAAVRAGEMKLVEATYRGRSNRGNLRPKGQTKGWHLAPDHDLATQVKARCTSLGHPRGRTVGGIACGECWETVIRTDERAKLIRANVEQGTCPTCGEAHHG